MMRSDIYGAYYIDHLISLPFVRKKLGTLTKKGNWTKIKKYNTDRPLR